jgi:hypothetical protein
MRLLSPVRLVVAVVATGVLVGLVVYILPPVLFALIALSHSPVRTQLQRVESPDHAAAAILIEETPGFSIEPAGYRVYVAPARSTAEPKKPVLEGTSFKDLKMTWLAPNLLQISYSLGCIGAFRNHSSVTLRGQPYAVEVRLKAPDDITPRRCD